MDNCCLVQKEVEDDIWLFLQLEYYQKEVTYSKDPEDQEYVYLDSIITEQLAVKILEHFYLSFKTFNGRVSRYLFLKQTQELQKTLQSFVVTYQEINRYEELKKLDISSFLFPNIRAMPLDINSVLKFGYFKNVMESYESSVAENLIFSHGLLIYSTLPKELTQFFAHYFYGTGEPYKFEPNQFQKRLRIVGDLFMILPNERYGTVYNSYNFGFGQAPQENDPRATYVIQSKLSQDLLGI